ncbi:EamA family transporter [Rhodococcus sp. NPDC003382]|uniref:EamA family transporter n=1 Tax=unclassified Rhodococcus (in: high G+C Gram-positive bacteria) TaxID=192944 RepID=UPI0018CFBD6F|nr:MULTISPECIES: EamA family transporter [unclassified Rhodococcus (in: high G+C Gram-positive bacteria)]MBH0119486.1 EamA family transporter [Rhodococcus sp. CX]MCK8674817.1 EamA family transporter [Rhodococcus sp. HM1]
MRYPEPARRAVPVAAVLGSVLSIQFGAAFASTLFDRVGAAGTVTLRLVIGAIVLCAVARPASMARSTTRAAARRWTRAEWRGVLALGASLAVMNAFFYEAIARLPLAVAVTIEFLGPLTLAAVLSRRLRDGLWVLLALAGVVLLGVGGNGFDSAALDPLGVACALVAASGWAWYIVAGSHVATNLAGTAALAGATTVAAVAVLPFGVAAGGTELLSPGILAAGFGVAMLSSVIPYSLEIRALRDLPKGVFAILIALEPAAAALAGSVVLGQFVDLPAAVGIALVIVAGVGALRGSRI